MKTLTRWIVIRNGDETRLVSNRPTLKSNEVAVSIKINVPQPPRIVANVEITLPDPPPAHAESEIIEYPEDP